MPHFSSGLCLDEIKKRINKKAKKRRTQKNQAEYTYVCKAEMFIHEENIKQISKVLSACEKEDRQ